jgi:plasmid stability protein
MGVLTVRNIDDGLLEKLKELARANERSMEAEVRVLLQAAAENAAKRQAVRQEPKVMTAADWEAVRLRVREYMGGKPTPSTAVDDIREFRDAEI